MSFVDNVRITAAAGDGGDGKLSFRHEKFIAKGGPDGGDGGDGGDVVLVATRNQNTLAAFRYQKLVKSEPGSPGGQAKRHGKSGQDLLVDVPVGTMATNVDGEIVADLVEDGQSVIVAHGGRGGFGNAHFVSSRRQAPKVAEKGEPGEIVELNLELKMIADVGLVGLPNAGKSTLLNVLSNAHPQVASYPFTTLTPHLGVVDIDKKNSLLFADIPGLIKGAAKGKGLGHDFLRHVERTAVILHLIDAYTEDVAEAYTTIRDELKAYRSDLAKRPEVVLLTKVEGLDQEIINDLSAQIKRVASKKTPIMPISAQSGEGVRPMLFAVAKAVQQARTRAARAEKSKQQRSLIKPGLPVLRLPKRAADFAISQEGTVYIVTGSKIENFARRTDFSSQEGVQRLRDIMRRHGITSELNKRGIELGQTVQFGRPKIGTIDY